MNSTNEISPWAFTQARNEMSCSRCGAQPGKPCKTPKGRKVGIPHKERNRDYFDKIGIQEFKRRHMVPYENNRNSGIA